MRPLHASLGFALLFATSLSAQAVAGSFSPNPVAPGVVFSFTGTDATGAGANLPSPCGWFRIHQGTPTGPVIPLGVACGQVIVPIPPNGSFTFSWDQRDANGALVAPGQYWVETRVWDAPLRQLNTDYFCISIQPASAPALTTAGNPRVGQSVGLSISSPGDPGGLYFTALSLSSNNPAAIIGLQTCLSLPVTGDGITNGVGLLDGSGRNGTLAVNVPNLPALAYFGFHTQAVIFDGSQFKLTNDLSFTIQP